MPNYEDVKTRFQNDNRMEVFEQAVEDACQKIMRQTDYTRDVAHEKLQEHDLDIIQIVREWMGAPVKKEKVRSTNQMVFDEFRSFLDQAANKYYKKKELEERRKQIMQQAAAAELARRKAAIKHEGTLETVEEVSDEQISPKNSDIITSENTE